MKQRYLHALVFLFSALISFVVLFSMLSKKNQSDFIEFYSAASILKSDQNPYDPLLMLLKQRQVVPEQISDKALMLWSPPWILPLMGLTSEQNSYGESKNIWNAISVFLIFFSLILVLGSYFGQKIESQIIVIFLLPLLVCAAPFLDSFNLSQSAPWMLFAGSLFVYSVSKNKFFLSGIATSLWCLKPHLFLIVGFAWVASLLFHSKSYTHFLSWMKGFLIGLITLIGISEYCFPGGTRFWLNTLLLQDSDTYTVNRLRWICSNLTGALKTFLPNTTILTINIIPLSVIAVVLYAIIKDKRNFSSLHHLSWLFPLSLFCAPFGWIYDQNLCLLSFGLLLPRLLEKKLYSIIGMIFTLNFIGLIYYTFLTINQVDLWWYSGVVFLLAVYSEIKISQLT